MNPFAHRSTALVVLLLAAGLFGLVGSFLGRQVLAQPPDNIYIEITVRDQNDLLIEAAWIEIDGLRGTESYRRVVTAPKTTVTVDAGAPGFQTQRLTIRANLQPGRTIHAPLRLLRQ